MALAMPGTPTMPVPSTLIIETSSMVAKPLTNCLPMVRTAGPSMTPSLQMVVPVASRLKKLRILMGVLYCMAGCVVRGCSTLAPKYDISHASW